MIIKKRGLSDVVATVFIIMLTVLAVAIIAGYVVPFVSNSLSRGGECVQYRNYFKFQESLDYNGKTYHYNCYEKDINDADLELHGAVVWALQTGAISGENITSGINKTSVDLNLVFIKTDTGESATAKIRRGEPISYGVGGVRMLDINIQKLKVPENGGVQTYVYSADRIYDSVEVYPVLENGRVCDKTDQVKLTKCDAVSNLNA